MKASIFFFLFILVYSINTAAAQEVTVDTREQPLNEVLIGIAAESGIEISFDHELLSRYRVTLSGTFPSPFAAIVKLTEGLPLEVEAPGDVMVISPSRASRNPENQLISGRVIDRYTHEVLPYAHVIINNRGLVADLAGGFSYNAPLDSIYAIHVSHLGYYFFDTVISVAPAAPFEIMLTPSMVGLSEVEIINIPISRSGLIGERAGQIKLNQQVASFLPGFGDNSVFNLLRLQPGILAAGEQTNDLVIWGSYEGQSKVMFDGFTVYALKNFNDNISSFNPLMAKDIEVYKGGYDARFGDRVGGIVNITGKNGNRANPSFAVNVNNMTLNSMVEIPLPGNGALVAAFRTTYYELYNPADINSRLWRNNDRDSANDVDLDVIPDYRFRDMNLKYSAMIRNRDLFFISLYGGGDRFSYSVSEALKNASLVKDTREENRQRGGSIFYGANWKNGSKTSFNLNYSGLTTEYSDQLTVEGNQGQFSNKARDLESVNKIREFTLQADHGLTAARIHRLEWGLSYKHNIVELQEDTFNIAQVVMEDSAQRVVAYFQDEMALGKGVSFKAGIRVNHAFNLKKFYFEPRLSLAYKAGEHWRINAAWGLYDQFIARSSVIDDLGNYRYFWAVCDNEDIPVLRAGHLVGGVTFEHRGFTVSLESYFKKTKGLTRFVRNNKYHSEGIFEGVGRSYGLDVMIKKDYRGHSAWVAYSLSRTEEVFEYFLENDYRRAPQDQRHELKAALLLNFDPFYFSADYVFGSGFPPTAYLQATGEDNLDYSRLDVAFIYKFLDRRVKGEAGLSILNVMNTKNIKYQNFERVPANQSNTINLYAEAIPLTPALYLKISM